MRAAIPISEYTKVEGWQNCFKVLKDSKDAQSAAPNNPIWHQGPEICLPKSRPVECLSRSWQKLKDDKNLPKCRSNGKQAADIAVDIVI